jgi:uncharacterized protein YndB with AHSA1/START domain
MPDIRHAITINAPPERVAALVESADGLAAWWAEDVDAVAGRDAVDLGFFDRRTVYRLVPQHQGGEIRWRCETGQEWAGTELVFRLEENPQGHTVTHFAHQAWAEASPYFVSCNTVWGHLMFVLKAAAERGGAARPLFTRSGMRGADAGGY